MSSTKDRDGKNFKNLSYADGLGNGGIESIEVDGKNIWLGGTQPAGTLTLYNGTAMKNFNMDDRQISWTEAIISSMTIIERKYPEKINGSRRLRIAKGSGRTVQVAPWQ